MFAKMPKSTEEQFQVAVTSVFASLGRATRQFEDVSREVRRSMTRVATLAVRRNLAEAAVPLPADQPVPPNPRLPERMLLYPASVQERYFELVYTEATERWLKQVYRYVTSDNKLLRSPHGYFGDWFGKWLRHLPYHTEHADKARYITEQLREFASTGGVVEQQPEAVETVCRYIIAAIKELPHWTRLEAIAVGEYAVWLNCEKVDAEVYRTSMPQPSDADDQAAIDRANEAIRKQREEAEAKKSCPGDDAVL